MGSKFLAAVVIGLTVVANLRGVADRPDRKKKADTLKQELARVQGTWTTTGWIAGGAKVQGEARLTVRGNRWFLTVNSELMKGTFKLYPTRKVRAFDATVSAGTGKGYTFFGVYGMSGDTLTICWCIDAKTRPAALTSDGSDCIFFIWKRGKR
jgi:uncharacterized protein (TIGR03067 family)